MTTVSGSRKKKTAAVSVALDSSYEKLICKSLEDIQKVGDLERKSVDWLYRYFCSSLGYQSTRNRNGTYKHTVKESFQNDTLELDPFAFSDFQKVYQRFLASLDENID